MDTKVWGRVTGVVWIWRELLLPVLIAISVLAIAVALVEGPALDTFLYAVF